MLGARGAVVLAACATIACGGASSGSRAPEEPSATPTLASLIALREDQIARLHQRAAAIPFGDPRSAQIAEELADALVALSAEYRSAALAADPGVASVPPPADAGMAEASDSNATEIDQAPDRTPPPPPTRDEAALSKLSPRARALLGQSDRVGFEAVDALGQAMYGPGQTPERETRISARRARLLADLGQLTDARRDWKTVIFRSSSAADTAQAWLAFAQWFADQGKRTELATALEKASEAAANAHDPKVLAAVCTRANDAGVKPKRCP